MSVAPQKIARAQAGLVVVDVQERLLPAMFEGERLVRNVTLLIKSASILGLPVLATEQYLKGLGPTVGAVAQLVPGFAPLQKLTFSATGAEDFLEELGRKRVSEIILCGIEAHVCVTQTCLDLMREGLRVFVVADAVASRTFENQRIGIERMRDAGAVIVSTEMILFELLEKAGSEEFKQILAIVK